MGMAVPVCRMFATPMFGTPRTFFHFIAAEMGSVTIPHHDIWRAVGSAFQMCQVSQHTAIRHPCVSVNKNTGGNEAADATGTGTLQAGRSRAARLSKRHLDALLPFQNCSSRHTSQWENKCLGKFYNLFTAFHSKGCVERHRGTFIKRAFWQCLPTERSSSFWSTSSHLWNAGLFWQTLGLDLG